FLAHRREDQTFAREIAKAYLLALRESVLARQGRHDRRRCDGLPRHAAWDDVEDAHAKVGTPRAHGGEGGRTAEGEELEPAVVAGDGWSEKIEITSFARGKSDLLLPFSTRDAGDEA